MKIKSDEITSVIKQEIEQYSAELSISEVGKVVEVGDGIARVYGLSNVMAGELLEFQGEQTSLREFLEQLSAPVAAQVVLRLVRDRLDAVADGASAQDSERGLVLLDRRAHRVSGGARRDRGRPGAHPLEAPWHVFFSCGNTGASSGSCSASG